MIHSQILEFVIEFVVEFVAEFVVEFVVGLVAGRFKFVGTLFSMICEFVRPQNLDPKP